jgi:hypothetical protein
MNKEGGIMVGGWASWIYSVLGPATEVIQFVTAVIGLVAICLSVYLYWLKIKGQKNV